MVGLGGGGRWISHFYSVLVLSQDARCAPLPRRGEQCDSWRRAGAEVDAGVLALLAGAVLGVECTAYWKMETRTMDDGNADVRDTE